MTETWRGHDALVRPRARDGAGGGAGPESPEDAAAASGPEAGFRSTGQAPAASDFAALTTPHLQAMLRAAAALVGSADAEDATQEAIVRAWRAWDSLRDPGGVRPWLLRITINVCRDWQRGRFGTRVARNQSLAPEGSEREGRDVSEGDLRLATLSSDPGTSDHTGALDLRAAINRLEPELRVVVALRYYAGMDATVTGHALGIPSATVRTRLRRALRILRESLEADSDSSAATKKATPRPATGTPDESEQV